MVFRNYLNSLWGGRISNLIIWSIRWETVIRIKKICCMVQRLLPAVTADTNYANTHVADTEVERFTLPFRLQVQRFVRIRGMIKAKSIIPQRMVVRP